jgi:hypothetical protein
MILLTKCCRRLRVCSKLEEKSTFLRRGGQSLVQEKLTVFLHPNYNALEEGLQDLKKWRKIKLESNRHVK